MLPQTSRDDTKPSGLPSPRTRAVTKPQTLDDLLGFRGVTILKMLGQPDLKRSEWPAEIWQYANKTCVLDIVFYRYREGLIADYAEERDRQGTKLAEDESCLTSLTRQ